MASEMVDWGETQEGGWKAFKLGENAMWDISCDLLLNMSVITFFLAISLSLVAH